MYRKRREILFKNEINSNLNDEELESLTDAAVIFDLFKSKLCKPVKVLDCSNAGERKRGTIIYFQLCNKFQWFLKVSVFCEIILYITDLLCLS